jgi:hypothetical protein
VTVSQDLQFIEHGGNIPRHADLVGLGLVGAGAACGFAGITRSTPFLSIRDRDWRISPVTTMHCRAAAIVS